jgi:uncharacterized protein YifE (UPF0438 family)
MADLKPLGSEKLQGTDKLKRIMEIARYGEVEKPQLTESTVEYSVNLADGKTYSIVNEKNGYIIKCSINESESDYIDVIQNRKYYKSYSAALKSLNLKAKEINRLFENEEGVALFGEQKKFVLKTPKPEVEAPAPAPAPEEAPVDDTLDLGLDAEPAADGGEDLNLDLGLDEPMDDGEEEMSLDVSADETPAEGDEEEGSFKFVQKLTGKLGQKLRTLDEKQGLTSENIKYVINSILSAVDLTKLSPEDYEDILSNFEEDEEGIDYGVDDESELNVDAGDELDLGTGDEELDLDLGIEEPAGEAAESEMFGGKLVDEIFSESKVEKVLSKYFQISEQEQKEIDDKKTKRYISEVKNRVLVKSQIKTLSESIEQEMTADFLLGENETMKFLGKTNKGNLVFENEGNQIKVSPKGELL